MSDHLLECLVFLTAHFGRAKSAEALKSGLAYDEGGMGPELFCEAAERLGLNTKINKKSSLKSLPQAVLPVVLILNDNQACVLLELSKNKKKAKVFLPETGGTKEIDIKKLQADYAGACIYVHPRAEFKLPETVHLQDTDRHWFWSLVNANRGVYGMALLAAVFINLFGLTSPLFIMNVYDRVIPNNAIETGWILGIGALTIFVFDFIMRTLRAYLIDIAGRRIDVIATRRIYDQVMNMKLAGRPRSSGAFANMLKDFDSVRDFFTSATITVLVDLPFTAFFLFVIYKLAGDVVFILMALIVAVVVIGLILQFPLKALVRKATQSAEAKHGMLVETIGGLETIKAIGGDGRFRSFYGDHVGESAAYGQRSRFVSGLGVNLSTFLQQIASILIVLAGMYLVQDGTLTVGGLIAAVILGGRAMAPIGQVANLMTRYHQASGALKTIEKIMRQDLERPPHRQFLNRPDLKGGISFDQVSFSYPNAGKKALDSISFNINSGERVGVIGKIGSGKSTIARLILGLHDPEEGVIMADGTDMRQIDPADLRRNIGYIAQDVMLFSGSVRDNITIANPQASDEEVLSVAVAAGVHEFVSRHPMGYDAPVGERGEFLSGGQRQAIALARAMLNKPNLFVCDEPTNALDVQAERQFCDYIQNEIKGKTLIMITHRQNMLELVDRLILMDQGKILMDDTRENVVTALKGGKVKIPSAEEEGKNDE